MIRVVLTQFATRIIVLNAQYMVLNEGVGFEERERVKVLVSNSSQQFGPIRMLIKDKIETLENAIQQINANGEAIERAIYPWDQALRAFEKYEQDEIPKMKKANYRAEPKGSVCESNEDRMLLTRK